MPLTRDRDRLAALARNPNDSNGYFQRMSSTVRNLVLVAFAAALTGCGSANPYQGMTDEQLYMLARQKYEEQDWDDAIRALDRFFVSFGASDRSAEARLMLADAYFGKGDYLTARSEYQRYIDRFPGEEGAPVAALGMCKALSGLSPVPERDQGYTNEAITTCRNVVTDYAGTPQAQEAATLANGMRVKLAEKEFLNADFYSRRELYDSAIKYYEFVVRLYPETPYAPRALLGIYEANKAIGYDDLAEDARDRLLEQYPDSPAASSVRADGNGNGG
jgi:outer membrane protein assembly factor BamD